MRSEWPSVLAEKMVGGLPFMFRAVWRLTLIRLAYSVFPVLGITMKVHDREDEDFVFFFSLEDAIWKPFGLTSSNLVI